LLDYFAMLASDSFPAVAKKDPHPGNWLRTPGGQLVLIDIEATTSLPLIQEAAVVIGDLPLFPLSDEGWTQRMAFMRTYLESLSQHGSAIAADALPIREAYEAFTILNAVRGTGRLHHADPGVSSFSQQARQLQRRHYVDLLADLSERGTITRSDDRDMRDFDESAAGVKEA
jgi:hypothetical protein